VRATSSTKNFVSERICFLSRDDLQNGLHSRLPDTQAACCRVRAGDEPKESKSRMSF